MWELFDLWKLFKVPQVYFKLKMHHFPQEGAIHLTKSFKMKGTLQLLRFADPLL